MKPPLLAMSGDEIVAALMRGGVRIVREEADAVVLASALHTVRVTTTAMVHEAEVYRILREASLSYVDFFELLDAESSSDLERETEAEPEPESATAVRTATGKRRRFGGIGQTGEP